MRPAFKALAALVVLGVSGCGGPEAAVYLRIEAPLRVPEDCDEVRIEARWEGSDEVAYEQSFPLGSDGPDFPLELSLTADTLERGDALRVRAEALLGGERAKPWSEATTRVELVRNEMTPVVLKMCDCP
ncbi:MAG: hypothetical protein WBV82_07910 [Myxococcaceae bacterium]